MGDAAEPREDSVDRLCGLVLAPPVSSHLCRAGEWLSDLPVMSERIDNPSHAPAVRLVGHGRNNFRSRRHGALKRLIRISHNHHHPHSTAAERFGTKILVFRRLVRKPELASVHRELRYYIATLTADTEQFLSSERRLVKLNCPRPISN